MTAKTSIYDNMPVALSGLKAGESAIITEVEGETELRCHLLDMGLIPKTKVTVRKIAPMGDPIELFLRGYELTIRKDDAKGIKVTRI